MGPVAMQQGWKMAQWVLRLCCGAGRRGHECGSCAYARELEDGGVTAGPAAVQQTWKTKGGGLDLWLCSRTGRQWVTAGDLEDGGVPMCLAASSRAGR